MHIWTKRLLPSGSLAFAFLNIGTGGTPTKLSIKLSELGLKPGSEYFRRKKNEYVRNCPSVKITYVTFFNVAASRDKTVPPHTHTRFILPRFGSVSGYKLTEVFESQELGTFKDTDVFTAMINPTGIFLAKATPS